MSDSAVRLSSRAVAVLEMIAAGSTYEQILSAYPDFTYLDIFRAAEEALDLAVGLSQISPSPRPTYTVAEKRDRYPRAYEKWTDTEDDRLRSLVQAGGTIAQIAGQLQRNRGAIRSRVMKLGLVDSLIPNEKARLERMIAREPVDEQPE